MTAEDFPEAVEHVRQLSNTLKDKTKLVLQKASPHIETLLRENTHFFPSFPNSVWERRPRNSVSRLQSLTEAKRSFAKGGCQTEFGNQKTKETIA